MPFYLFTSGDLKYVAYAESLNKAVEKFIKSIVNNEIPENTRIAVVAEIRKLSPKTWKPVGGAYYCLASPFLVASGKTSFRDLVESLHGDVETAQALVNVAKLYLGGVDLGQTQRR
ncbi:MAG: hypothetical protein QXL22_01195 [Candidatus Nezhaarchaeales archaeon]